VNSVAARRSAQPLYDVYLARVIKIQAVQCHRAAATDDSIEKFLFFDAGCRPGLPGHFQWNLDTWDAFPPGPFASVITPVSVPMQRAWNAAVAAFKELIKALANGDLIANGLHPVSGVRSDLDRAEWTCAGLTLDVRNGILYEERSGKHVLWSAITLRAAKQPRQKKARWHGYDWDGAWAYALTLRAENQWDWTKHRRDKKQPLPALHRTVEEMIERWFAARGRIPAIEDIRRNIVAPLYAGKHTRPRRKR
jgi:hypothetical protein